MKVTCTECKTIYQIPDEKITSEDVVLRCKKCNSKIHIAGNKPKTTSHPKMDPDSASKDHDADCVDEPTDNAATPNTLNTENKSGAIERFRAFVAYIGSKNAKVVAVLVALVILNVTAIPDKFADDYVDNALEKAAMAYIVSRGLNATISIIQDAEIGVGIISVSPGEILDPMNDLVERFSSVMLFATASLGVQKLLLLMSQWGLLKLLIVALLLLLVIHYLYRKRFSVISDKALLTTYKVLVLMLALRFAVPFMAIASDFVEDAFIADQMNNDITALENVDKSMEKIASLDGEDVETNGEKATTSKKQGVDYEYIEEAPSFGGFLNHVITDISDKKDAAVGSVKQQVDAVSPTNLKAKIDTQLKRMSDQMEKSVEVATRLISLFIVQSVLMPILFLWLIVVGSKGLYRYKFDD